MLSKKEYKNRFEKAVIEEINVTHSYLRGLAFFMRGPRQDDITPEECASLFVAMRADYLDPDSQKYIRQIWGDKYVNHP